MAIRVEKGNLVGASADALNIILWASVLISGYNINGGNTTRKCSNNSVIRVLGYQRQVTSVFPIPSQYWTHFRIQ